MIVVVEDHDGIRDSLRLLLECEGLPVRDFASCQEFLAVEGKQETDCLLLDVHMPGMSGLELLEHLRAQGTMVPAILITGDPAPNIRKRAAAAGALALFEKPFESGDLVDLIRNVII